MKKRISELKAMLSSGEAALITSYSNRFYLTAFSSSAGFVLITENTARFYTDSRYFEAATKRIENLEVILLKNQGEQLKNALCEGGIKKLYIETEDISVKELERYCELLPDIQISTDSALQKKLSEMRAVKSSTELSLIKAAQEITDRAFLHILEFISPDKTEREIALELEFFMRLEGSEGVAFDTIAVSGENSSLPHGVPCERRLRRGDFLTMDFGAKIGGYCSDMTRTVAIGEVSDSQKAVYETVLRAQCTALKKIKAGISGAAADESARAVITEAGYGEYFGHSLGHSLGIDIHEAPNASPSNRNPLPEGAVVTVEPGIYLPQKFGVRIEDMIYITEEGCINLTNSPKELIIL